MGKSERTIRVDLTRSGIKRITMLPLDNEGVEIMKEHGNDAEEACSDIYDKVWSEDSGQLMDFVFENAYSEYGLYVVDAETEEEIYEDDSFVPDTSCGLMSYSEAEAEYREYDDDEEGFSSYVKYLRSECQTNELYLSQGFAKAWNELSEPTTESAATFIPNFMLYALSAADAKNALLMGVEESELVTVSFYINLPEGENFDPAKLDFINIDEDYDAYSEVLQELLARDIILLNAIIYDGKIYFAGHDDIDILGVSGEEPIFDYVDENIAKKKMNFYEFITNVRISYDYYDEQEYDEDDENYLSAQLDFSELADDEIDRFFDILGDECDFPNEALWTMVDYDGELERDSLIDIDDENAGMEILMQYPEAFVKAAHKFLAEQEGEECEEAIYGVGGYFWWGDDELEEEFSVEEIAMGAKDEEGLMENGLYIEKLGDWFREYCIVETEDDVYYDAYGATEEETELFVNNIKAQYGDEEAEHIENLSFATADDFVKFLDEDEGDLSLPYAMVCAAYCAQQGIAIDDDTRICEDVQLYYFNDSCEFHYEYETDIDLG